MNRFDLVSPYAPAGDQPKAIDQLVGGLNAGLRHQTLLGVTGSGKTFTMANVIQRMQKPALVISHNKTLAAQLYSEFKAFFPNNAVAYFVSYYDYYQPEAYIPARDIYIEKDAAINQDIDRLRLAATSALMSRSDVIIVASVSCIYGLGSPDLYSQMAVLLGKGQTIDRTQLLRSLSENHYQRNELDFSRGKFRVRGDAVEVFPAYDETAIRIELDFDTIAEIQEIHPLTGEILGTFEKAAIFPAKHYVMPEQNLSNAIESITAELEARLKVLRDQGKLLEAQRLEMRTRYDLEMIEEVGYCSGIENYSRHLDGRAPGTRPFNLMDFFPKDDYLLFLDESHVTIPQVGGMYEGDMSRKRTLVEHGFRLPSAMDNRPMKFSEFEAIMPPTIYVSATPRAYELEKSTGPGTAGRLVEQLIRPTGLVDPPIEIRKTDGQIDDILRECRTRAARNERVLVTALTKRLSEDLATHLREAGLRCRYLHSEIDAIERVEILKNLRQGKFDVLVGVNLLREGLDLPEVSLVMMLDADKEGFLRSKSSLIQNIGRAARNVGGEVILYADRITDAMRDTISECERRRTIQLAYNAQHGITPQGIHKEIGEGIEAILAQRDSVELEHEITGISGDKLERAEAIKVLEEEMEHMAEELRFEEAARLRDRILDLKGEKKIERGIGGLRRKRNKRATVPKSMRGTAAALEFPELLAAEDPAQYGRKRR
ncbi:MAG TPA: excinuclease ABC subunit UvrB [Planctomycetota bacterium]|nr:excinuclease ABC subunit UvrB [Planctomycetota bacterium]